MYYIHFLSFLLLGVACVCTSIPGKSRQKRVIGGSDARADTYTWQVSIQDLHNGEYTHFCGGSLIASKSVLTAAHCRRPLNRMTVYVGSINKYEGGTRIGVSAFAVHPGYASNRAGSKTYDFAIITLKEAAVYSYSIAAIALPAEEQPTKQYSGDGTVSGWGYINYGPQEQDRKLPVTLQHATLTIKSNAQCSWQWGRRYESNTMICAGGNNDGFCMDDFGGPFVTNISGEYTLIGIVSWGSNVCSTSVPSVFAKVTSVMDWIKGNTY